MKYLGILFVGLVAITFGCKTEEEPFDEVEQFNLDIEKIDNYIADNGITDTLHHPTEIRYTINKTGTGTTKPRLTDFITVNYEGRFIDTNEVFDSGIESQLYLNQTILGWQIMVQQMHEGDNYTIYLPSFFGYGPDGSPDGTIPPNTVVVFDVELVRIGL